MHQGEFTAGTQNFHTWIPEGYVPVPPDISTKGVSNDSQ